jgi:hypothetical protein
METKSVIYWRQVRMPKIHEISSTDDNGKHSYRLKYGSGKWWYIELHLQHFGLYGPAALAVVHEQSNGYVEFLDVQTNSDLLCKGYATELVRAVRTKWPRATWCDTPDSRPFHQSLVRKGIAKLSPDTQNTDSHSLQYAFTDSPPEQ